MFYMKRGGNSIKLKTKYIEITSINKNNFKLSECIYKKGDNI